MDVQTGMIVRSAAGRDKGKFMVIAAIADGFVYLADGKERKLASPKKKNEKHICPTKTVISTDDLTDKGLRKILREYAEKDFS
ncbi:MAG: KOW domain-containing RNA-binding protein [Oscillospiraceae bacterium]|nr:KOW domain-containing RNA-binding protein [Oscillospiraceae bacterium]